jgi:hypothetical protein
MAPVTGRVANADDYHFITFAGHFQNLILPWIPFYRIIGVLQKIRAAFVNQMVRVFHGVNLEAINKKSPLLLTIKIDSSENSYDKTLNRCHQMNSMVREFFLTLLTF